MRDERQRTSPGLLWAAGRLAVAGTATTEIALYHQKTPKTQDITRIPTAYADDHKYHGHLALPAVPGRPASLAKPKKQFLACISRA
jgi:hypothetical protein